MKPHKIFFFSFFLSASCQFPKDPNHTLENVLRTRVIKVGWCDARLESAKIEKGIIAALAKRLHAKILWKSATGEELYRLLEYNKIDLVACRIENNSPWREKLAFTIPYQQDRKLVFALPPGENAWLNYVNTFLFNSKVERNNDGH